MTPIVRIDAIIQPGVSPGKGFYDTLLAPFEAKDYISNESRLEDGIRVLSTPVKFKKRSFTLEFQITGATPEIFENNKRYFFQSLSVGKLTLNVQGLPRGFDLIYTGKSNTYSGGLSGCACKVKIGFDEPNPNSREVF